MTAMSAIAVVTRIAALTALKPLWREPEGQNPPNDKYLYAGIAQQVEAHDWQPFQCKIRIPQPKLSATQGKSMTSAVPSAVELCCAR
jgi:hypothetical protein